MSNMHDLDDPVIREMIETNHAPTETWRLNGTLVSVNCQACFNAWPCVTVLKLRAWKKKSYGYERPNPSDPKAKPDPWRKLKNRNL